MNERDALLTTAVRAIETVDGDRESWTDEDRSWSSRAAAEAVGEGATPTVFVACRARFAVDRLRPRDPGFVRLVDGLLWRGWIGALLMMVSFAAGRAHRSHRIRPEHQPAGATGARLADLESGGLSLDPRQQLAPWRQSKPAKRAPCAASWSAACLASGRRLRQRGVAMPTAVQPRLLSDWSQIAAPLYAARVARLLHFSAALFAAGIISGLYLRGLAFEYRAGWESTFLGAEAVHRLLSVLLAPGLWLHRQRPARRRRTGRNPLRRLAGHRKCRTVVASSGRDAVHRRHCAAPRARHCQRTARTAAQRPPARRLYQPLLSAPAARLPRRTGSPERHPLQLSSGCSHDDRTASAYSGESSGTMHNSTGRRR
jgi:hypothetical protein